MRLKSKIALYRLLLVLILATLSTLPVYPLSYSTATDTTDSDFGAGLVKSSVTIVGTGDAAYIQITSTNTWPDSTKWLNGWKYRRAININNSLSYGLSDYQVWIPTTAFGSSWSLIRSSAQSTMADFRFTPSTSTNTFPYWIEDNTSTPKGFWVRISTLPAGSNDIYIYYGNISVSSASNGTNTFLFFDDFDGSLIDSNKWLRTTGSSISNGWLVAVVENTGHGGSNYIYSNNVTPTLSNYIIEYRSMSTASNSGGTVLFNIEDPSSPKHYGLQHDTRSPNDYDVLNRDGGITGFLAGYNTVIWNANEIVRNKIVKSDLNSFNHIRYSESSTDRKTEGPFTGLNYTSNYYVGASRWGDLRLDWIFVRKYAPTEPTISSVGSEEGPYFPAGEFQSRVIDTGKKGTVWGNISWGQNLPDGTSIKLRTRTGDTSTPDGSWSSWSPSSEWFTINSGTPIASPRARYIQYISSFTTNVSTSTPQLLEVTIQYATNTATAPNLVSPTDGVWLSTTQPVFVWNFVDNELDTQTGFRLQIATHTNRSTGAPYGFTGNIIYDSGEVASSTSQHQPTAQIPNGFLYWVVKTSDTYGEWSVYSSTYCVKLDTQPPAGQSVISFASGVSSLTITCGNGSDGNGAGLHTSPYYIEISTNSNFSSAVNSGWVANSYTFNNLLRNKKYYARIKARDILGNESVWSGNFEWKTRPGTYQAKTSQGEPARTGQNAFGLVGDGLWEWQIPVKSGLPLTITAYIRYNTEYGGSATKPKLTLYGKGISPTSVSATSAAENAWELLTINAGTPSENAMLKLRAEGFSTNPGAKFYIDDIKVNQ